MRSLVLRLCAVPVLFTATTFSAETVSIVVSADATLYESPTLTSVSASGSGTWIFAGRTRQGELRRALLRFDVAGALPPGSTINSVSLALQVDRSVTGGFPATLHALTSAWGEGSSDAGGQGGIGGTPMPNDATWFHRFYPSVLWTTPGGDFRSTPSATATLAGPGDYSFVSTPGLVSDVQAWLDNAASNHGWMLRGFELDGSPSSKRLPSAQSPDVAARPRLLIDFTPPRASCDSLDFNNDGLFPDDADIIDFLSVLAGGPCSNDPQCNDIDFNNDGLFPDDADLVSFLNVLAGGGC